MNYIEFRTNNTRALFVSLNKAQKTLGHKEYDAMKGKAQTHIVFRDLAVNFGFSREGIS